MLLAQKNNNKNIYIYMLKKFHTHNRKSGIKDLRRVSDGPTNNDIVIVVAANARELSSHFIFSLIVIRELPPRFYLQPVTYLGI